MIRNAVLSGFAVTIAGVIGLCIWAFRTARQQERTLSRIVLERETPKFMPHEIGPASDLSDALAGPAWSLERA